MKQLSKKGQLNGMSVAILALVFASLVLIFGLVILQELSNVDVIQKPYSATITNESEAATPLVAIRVDDADTAGFTDFVVTEIRNQSHELINAANYTYTSAGVINMNLGTWNQSPLNVSYTYNYGGEAYSGANLTILGIATFADFWDIIVLVIVVSIIIGLLILAFGSSKFR